MFALNVQSFIISEVLSFTFAREVWQVLEEEEEEVNEVKLVLQTVNYSKNSVWKFGKEIQNHWDNNAFCAMGSLIFPHPVHKSL